MKYLFSTALFILGLSGLTQAASQNAHKITVNAKGSYLDITETISIPTNGIQSVYFTPTFATNQVPISVSYEDTKGIHNVRIFKSDTTSLVKIDSTEGNAQLYDDYYTQGKRLNITLNKVSSPKILIRYLLSHQNLKKNGFFISSLEGSTIPFALTLNVQDSSLWNFESQPSLKSSTVLRELDQAEYLYYKNTGSVWMTELTGDLAGQYLNTIIDVPDSVRAHFYKPTEAVILWRWNNPSSYFDNQGNLNYWGQTAIQQAKNLSQFLNTYSALKYKLGLVQSVENFPSTTWPLSDSGSTGLIQMNNWLNSITENTMRKQYWVQKQNTAPNWAPIKSTQSAQSADSLLSHLKLAIGLFTTKSGIQKHIIALSVGEAANNSLRYSTDSLQALFGEVTYSQDLNMQWSGVDVSQFNTIHPSPNMSPYSSLPNQHPEHIDAIIKSDVSKTYSADQASQVYLRSLSQWDTTITYIAKYGSGTDTLVYKPRIERTLKDSNLVLLWANAGQVGGKLLDSVNIKLNALQTGVDYGFNGVSAYSTNVAQTENINYKRDNLAILSINYGLNPLWNLVDHDLQVWLPFGFYKIQALDLKGRVIQEWSAQGNNIWNLNIGSLTQNAVILRFQSATSAWQLNIQAQ